MRAGRVDLEFGRQRLDGAPPLSWLSSGSRELVAVAGLPVVLPGSPARARGAGHRFAWPVASARWAWVKLLGAVPSVLPSDDVRAVVVGNRVARRCGTEPSTSGASSASSSRTRAAASRARSPSTPDAARPDSGIAGPWPCELDDSPPVCAVPADARRSSAAARGRLDWR